jgi:hypothetical protein
MQAAAAPMSRRDIVDSPELGACSPLRAERRGRSESGHAHVGGARARARGTGAAGGASIEAGGAGGA